MQPKRIIISLLVVILALLSAGTVVSAEDSTALDIAVEVSSSTALSDNLCVVSDGDVVTVSVTIKSNTGISGASFDILYNPAYLRPTVTLDEKLNWTSSGIFGTAANETATFNNEKGWVRYTVFASNGNLTQTGKVFTCTFIAMKHGNTELKLDMNTKDATYIKADGSWASIDSVRISYGANTAATAVPVKIHTLSSTYTTVPATCTSGGMKAYSCTTCSETVSISDGTPSLGHTPVVVPSVPVSCTQDGLTEGTKCSVCNAVITAQLVAVEKSDAYHTVVTDPAVAPTCSAVGYTEGSHCSTCNTVIVAQNEVAASGHTYGDWVNDKSEGVRTKTCSVCADTLTEPLPNSNNTLLVVIIVIAAVVVLGAAAVVVVVVLKKKKVV